MARRQRLLFEENAQHSAQRFSCAPEQLVPNGEGGEIRASLFQGKLAQASDRYPNGAAHRGRSQIAQRRLALVRNDSHPIVRLGEHLLDLIERQIAPELHGERLAVATHCAYAHANPVDGDRVAAPAQNLVGLRLPFPLLAALAVAEILVDPRKKTAGKRKSELGAWKGVLAQRRSHGPVDLEDRGGGIL